jgi:hypothetical protein
VPGRGLMRALFVAFWIFIVAGVAYAVVLGILAQ